MAVVRHEEYPLASGEDVVRARQQVREWALAAGFRLVEQTKLVTAASEIARNVLVHGGGGRVRLEALNAEQKRGLRLIFEDQGPGIANVEQALKDGFTTGGGLGLGLGGARRLVQEFSIEPGVGAGTTVTLRQWK